MAPAPTMVSSTSAPPGPVPGQPEQRHLVVREPDRPVGDAGPIAASMGPDAERRRARHRAPSLLEPRCDAMGSGLAFLSILSRECKIERPDPMELLVERDGPVLTVTFNRPAARNALTWAMYEGLYQACEEADADDGVRVLVLRGAGGQAFAAGTDIGQFTGFSTAEDGLRYERELDRWVGRLGRVAKPVIAAIAGV